MKILGVADGMTSGAALIEDGKITFAVNEERLIRQKMATGFPKKSISMVLDYTKTSPEEIDGVAVATINEFFREDAVVYDGWLLREQTPLKEFMLTLSSHMSKYVGDNQLFKDSYYKLKGMMAAGRRKKITEMLRSEWGLTCPVKFINHHLAHAYSAYLTSGLNNATIVTMDGAGDNSSSTVYAASPEGLKQVCNVDSYDSIGNYYAYVTHLCGFKAQRHEGKITGLAAYGKPTYLDTLRQFIGYEEGTTKNFGKVFYWSAVKKLEKVLPKDFTREDISASVQEILEETVSKYVNHWVDKTGCGDVALAGGVFANVKLNQRIHELGNVQSVFVHPGMGDDGLAVGAGLALCFELAKDANIKIEPYKIQDVYLGPEYDENDIKAATDSAGLEAKYENDIETAVAKLLAGGAVVARFDRRMEYGPRALGARSILYQPTDQSVNEWLNKRLIRTEFMPFAPVTLKEYEDECYKNMDGARFTANFMTITFDCMPEMQDRCPAVVHVDGTARPQIIEKEVNPSYYKIIDEYRKITGLPTIINTSFNMHEEPIVCTPSEAIRSFQQGHLDHLAIGNFLLKHEQV